jgi:hypothetical protein
MKRVHIPKTPHEKAMQRALLQWFLPQNRALVLQGLRQAGREDLIPVLLGRALPRRKPKNEKKTMRRR